MAMFYGYNYDNLITSKGGKLESGELNMNFYPLRNVPAPSEKYDVISMDYFLRTHETQSILYKYLGITVLNGKYLPSYNHGNHRGSGVLHSKSYTGSSVLYLHDISLDRDTLDYNIKIKFHARLIYKDKQVADFDISNGGVELSTKPNYTIDMHLNGILYPIRWIDLSIRVSLSDLTLAPEDLRFIIIIIEQVSGTAGGQESVLHCETKEY